MPYRMVLQHYGRLCYISYSFDQPHQEKNEVCTDSQMIRKFNALKDKLTSYLILRPLN